jgi:hypothetical protein
MDIHNLNKCNHNINKYNKLQLDDNAKMS